jgi:PAS domain S-box-containing protein
MEGSQALQGKAKTTRVSVSKKLLKGAGSEMPGLSPQDEKAYSEQLISQGQRQLRAVFAVLIVLYGGFGYLDLLLIEDYLRDFLLIRFAIVIPLFIVTIILSFYPVFKKIGQYMVLLSLVVGGSGISYMLIRHPDNVSYYGGVFMVIFAGYFLIKLNARFATAGGLLNLAIYCSGYFIYHQEIDLTMLVMLMFFFGSNVIGFVGNYQLETANKIKFRQEKEIQEKNRQLIAQVGEQHETLLQVKKAVESTSDAICMFDPRGKIFYMNKAFCNLTGFSLEELADNSKFDIIYDDPAHPGKIFDTVRDGSSWKGKQVVISRTGEKFVTQLHADAVRNEEGEVIASVFTHRDITNHMHVEDMLRKSEEQYRLLSDNVSDVIWTADLNLNYTFISPSIEVLNGYKVEELFGLSIGETLAPASLEMAAQVFQEEMVMEQSDRKELDRNRILELEHICKDGSRIWSEVKVNSLRNQQGLLTGILGITRDITERKKAEDALRLQANERAAVDSFTYSVSNDLQAPLRRIEGFSEALLEEYPDQLSDQARDYLERINRQIGSMKNLTDALLKLSRVVSHGIKNEEVNLSALARSHLEKLRYTEPARRVETVVAPDMMAMGDGDLLSVILENLLENAWKFTAGVEKAHIECGSAKQDGHTIYFVRDNGVGFDQQHSAKLFGPFQKLHNENEYPDIGIGLNIIYRIVTRHGGEVWAEGEIGKGATFYFTLPESR